MSKWPYGAWASTGMDAWALGIEASTVIRLRMAKLAAAGPGAQDEAQRMLSEKIQSAFELQTAFLTGGLGANPLTGTRKVIRHYRRKVRANRRRLG